MLFHVVVTRWRWLTWTLVLCCISTANCTKPNRVTWMLCACNLMTTSHEPTYRNCALDYDDSDITSIRNIFVNASSMQPRGSYQTVAYTAPRTGPRWAPCSTLAWRHWPDLVQSVRPGVQVTAQHGSRVPGWALQICLKHRQSPSQRLHTDPVYF